MKTVNTMKPNETFADNLYKKENKMRDPQDIKIGEYTLKEILDRHLQYLQDFSKKDMCADLHGTDLSYVDLSGTDLCSAKLYGTKLYGTDLSCTKLSCTNLCGANLSDANLSDANLSDANLSYTKLCGANLSDANLCGANLCGANLSYTNLSYTKLYGAKLRGVNLCGANLYGTDLCGANLYGINERYLEFRKGKILTESIIGYKKCRGDVIVTLEIPRGAVVFSINGNKCRTNKAKVISIDGADRAYSNYQHMNTIKYMSYYVGDEINIYNFNCEYNIECAEGIHFFMTREEAEK